jgi:hypothetical protein
MITPPNSVYDRKFINTLQNLKRELKLADIESAAIAVMENVNIFGFEVANKADEYLQYRKKIH